METISETWIRNASNETLNERFDGFFKELKQLISESTHWTTLSRHTSGDGTKTTVRRKPQGGSPWFLQRSSTVTSVNYADLRSVLFKDHSLQEPKYIELMQDARELLALSTNGQNQDPAGVYQLNYKATLASGREFVELVVARETRVDEQDENDQQERRAFMIVSKPVSDVTEPVRPGFVRGKYESWEYVEELENGTVQWTCIQRSEPGGWVPKCIADRVTAKALPQDVPSVIDYCKHKQRV
ncbi:Bet v1-like protein [Lichtheimia hyalospora FSU 10163]|nr:Bet v1-like protein [Lichtheimia hyalospora FSU 10163]